MEGRALGLGKNLFGCPRAFFATGFFRDRPFDGQRGAFILKTNFGLAPTHFFRRPGDPDNSDVTGGVAVENYRRWAFFIGDIFPRLPVGNPTFDQYGFWVTKFEKNNMGVQWSFRYYLTGELWNNSIVARGSCLGSYRVRGNSHRAGLAVTGSYGLDGQERHAFVSMIDRSTGTEIWRTPCPSEFPIDEGYAIVYDPSQGRYFMVGSAHDDNNGIWMYTAVVRDDGVFLGSNIHAVGPGAGFRDMMARDVCLSLSEGRAVAVGYVEVLEQGIPVMRTFAAELAIQPNTVAIWARFYQESISDIRSSEAIQPLRGRSPNTPGYLITTGGQLSQAEESSRDAQVIKIRPNGILGPSVNCGVIDFDLTPVRQQTRPPIFQIAREDFPWMRIPIPSHQQTDLSASSCEN